MYHKLHLKQTKRLFEEIKRRMNAINTIAYTRISELSHIQNKNFIEESKNNFNEFLTDVNAVNDSFKRDTNELMTYLRQTKTYTMPIDNSETAEKNQHETKYFQEAFQQIMDTSDQLKINLAITIRDLDRLLTFVKELDKKIESKVNITSLSTEACTEIKRIETNINTIIGNVNTISAYSENFVKQIKKREEDTAMWLKFITKEKESELKTLHNMESWILFE